MKSAKIPFLCTPILTIALQHGMVFQENSSESISLVKALISKDRAMLIQIRSLCKLVVHRPKTVFYLTNQFITRR